MKNIFIFALLAFSLTGLLAPSAMSDVFSDKGGNEKAKGNPQGCEDGKGKDATQNPNCDDSSSGGTGITSPCDTTGSAEGGPDGKIDANELAEHMIWPVEQAQRVIGEIEQSTDRGADIDGTINTSTELRDLNRTVGSNC